MSNPTMKDLEALDRAMFGDSSSTTDLQWNMVSNNNYMIKTLKKAAYNIVVAFNRQVKATEKDLKRAKKVFYG